MCRALERTVAFAALEGRDPVAPAGPWSDPPLGSGRAVRERRLPEKSMGCARA